MLQGVVLIPQQCLDGRAPNFLQGVISRAQKCHTLLTLKGAINGPQQCQTTNAPTSLFGANLGSQQCRSSNAPREGPFHGLKNVIRYTPFPTSLTGSL